MSYPRLAMRLYNTPHVIAAEKLKTIERVFRMHEDGTAKLLVPYEGKAQRQEVAPAGSAQRMPAGYVRTADGIGIVSVLGTLVHRSGFMDAESGLSSYMDIDAQLSAAMNDPQVKGILLEIDSDGGEVPGVFELGQRIRGMSEFKPVIAHANERALSGGYVLASAAEEIYTPQTGLVGSIGVRMMHVDQSKYDEKRGFVYTDIFAGAHKADFSPHAPLTDSELAWAQAHVDRTYDIFVDHVAQMRGIDPADVRATEADIYHAEEATGRGLIDGVATIGQTLDVLRARVADASSGGTHSMRMAARAGRSVQSSAQADIGANEMSDPKQVSTPAPAAPTADQLAEAQARGFQQANAEAETRIGDARAEGAKAAQERIAGILGHAEASGRDALAKHLAFNTNMTVDDAAKALAAAPKIDAAKPADRLDAAMRQIGNPKVGTDAPAADDDETEEAVAARIMKAPGYPKMRRVK